MTDARDPQDRLTETNLQRIEARMAERGPDDPGCFVYAIENTVVRYLIAKLRTLRSSHAGMLADMATVVGIIDAARAMPEPRFWNSFIQKYMCLDCGNAHPDTIAHAPDCPWLVLQEAFRNQ